MPVIRPIMGPIEAVQIIENSPLSAEELGANLKKHECGICFAPKTPLYIRKGEATNPSGCCKDCLTTWFETKIRQNKPTTWPLDNQRINPFPILTASDIREVQDDQTVARNKEIRNIAISAGITGCITSVAARVGLEIGIKLFGASGRMAKAFFVNNSMLLAAAMVDMHLVFYYLLVQAYGYRRNIDMLELVMLESTALAGAVGSLALGVILGNFFATAAEQKSAAVMGIAVVTAVILINRVLERLSPFSHESISIGTLIGGVIMAVPSCFNITVPVVPLVTFTGGVGAWLWASKGASLVREEA